MWWWNKYPYTDAHELNLDWVLKIVKDLEARVKALEDWKESIWDAINSIIDASALPIGSKTKKGIVQVGNGIDVAAGVISVDGSTLDISGNSSITSVNSRVDNIIDGTTEIDISGNSSITGINNAIDNIVDGTTEIDISGNSSITGINSAIEDITDGTTPIPSTYTLPIAGNNTLGGIKVGNNLSIDSDGVLSAVGGAVSSHLQLSITLEDTDNQNTYGGYLLLTKTGRIVEGSIVLENNAQYGELPISNAGYIVMRQVLTGTSIDNFFDDIGTCSDYVPIVICTVYNRSGVMYRPQYLVGESSLTYIPNGGLTVVVALGPYTTTEIDPSNTAAQAKQNLGNAIMNTKIMLQPWIS